MIVSRANKISFWVASFIVWQMKLVERVKTIEKFIRIAEVACPLLDDRFRMLT